MDFDSHCLEVTVFISVPLTDFSLYITCHHGHLPGTTAVTMVNYTDCFICSITGFIPHNIYDPKTTIILGLKMPIKFFCSVNSYLPCLRRLVVLRFTVWKKNIMVIYIVRGTYIITETKCMDKHIYCWRFELFSEHILMRKKFSSNGVPQYLHPLLMCKCTLNYDVIFRVTTISSASITFHKRMNLP